MPRPAIAMNPSGCHGETIELGGDPAAFEVRCSVHGRIAVYTVITVRILGSKQLQTMIDEAWARHEAEQEALSLN